MKYRILTTLTLVFLMQCATAHCGDPVFFYKDEGFTLKHYSTTIRRPGFTVGGQGDAGIVKAEAKANQKSLELDFQYNMGVNEIGAMGHGVAYPVVMPYRAFVPAAPPRVVHHFYEPDPYPYRYYPYRAPYPYGW